MAKTVLYDVLLIVKYVKTQTGCVLVNRAGWVHSVLQVISSHNDISIHFNQFNINHYNISTNIVSCLKLYYEIKSCFIFGD